MDRCFFVWCCTSVPRRLWYWYRDARMRVERGIDVGAALAAVNFTYFFFFFVFIELVPCAAGADPASHGVRLWRGWSASRVLLHRVSFLRVPLHGHPEVRKRPWPPLWGRGGDGDVGASPRSACERYVRCALPVCSLCLKMFSFPQCRLIIDPAGSNGLR